MVKAPTGLPSNKPPAALVKAEVGGDFKLEKGGNWEAAAKSLIESVLNGTQGSLFKYDQCEKKLKTVIPGGLLK